MIIQSPLAPKAYLSAMRKQMGAHTAFGQERFTGFFGVCMFYVTYHSGYEWDRRHNNPKNAAMGYAKTTDRGCEVHFLRFRGALCPLVFLPMLIIVLACCLFWKGFGTEYDLWIKLGIGFAVTLPTALLESFFESLSQRSEEGYWTLLSLLKDPSDPNANYYNRV